MDEFFQDKIVSGIDRVDAWQKVTGTAHYAGDFAMPGLAHAVLVGSTIARGNIQSIDSVKAEASAGVLAVVSHLNAPEIPGYSTAADAVRPLSGPLRIFFDDHVYFNGQPVAMVIAETFEAARYAADLVQIRYNKEFHHTDFLQETAKASLPKGERFADYVRGIANAYKTAEVQTEQQYTISVDVHNPMEMHTTLASWGADDLVTVHDKTQGVKSVQHTIMDAFKLPEEKVRVHAQFVGGAFGSGLRTWPHVIAAVLAAKIVKRQVKLVLTRRQMFTMVGYRPFSLQKIGLGATADGKLTGITHEAIGQTSAYEEFTDRTVGLSKFLYASPNVNTSYKILPLDVSTPTWMRGPGDATGSFALESAMDELSYSLGIDPLELRVRNHADINPEQNLPWSSKYLKECYTIGAERIGWKNRNPVPASMRDGELQVGFGMSSGTFGANRGKATAKAKITSDGRLLVQSAATDIGPGTGTAMVLIASEVMGIPVSKVSFELGDSSLPPAPTQGGSTLLSTVGSAVHDACLSLRKKLAVMAGNRFINAPDEEIIFSDEGISLRANAGVRAKYADILKESKLPYVEAMQESAAGKERQAFAMYGFSVHFVEVRVHSLTRQVKVHRVVSVADTGTIVSKKTARSQLIGGVVGGIGMSLMEGAIMDHRFGRYVNNNFADYHVPVNADVPMIEALFIDKKDPYTNPMGSKGLGEIAIVGFAAALANAVYHATGKRVRSLPITPDKLL